ncbi:Uma2 family endonuclease [Leptolyngbya sp. FACHB-671]|uniref:Uma2 family endonuclease n=1 Tax=Leptolyngbya sp. FACHB-671 TaxID=2692812 RepID=UPI0016852F63|nr:Uma2 family endonuclease [Leptolyngbya sp. FACHB-671]MBD2070943.1 Uma2 family endonuclease [Leptolyngbya sp. FACHB-671]
MQAKEQPHYSPEEYLALEETAEFRSEYCNGQIFPMAGGTPNHNRIKVNFGSALSLALTEQDYDIFISDMRLWIPRKGMYTYPDVIVVEGELSFVEGRKDTITNPLLIVEVLSDSTKNYDRGEKFEFYRTLASFREYVLVDQYKVHVEHCSKTANNQWLMTEYEQLDAVLYLVTVPLQIPLSNVYRRVVF